MIENAEHMRDANALNRAVFTIATGKQIYIEMAAALARSVMLWNPPEALPFYLVTDAPRSALPDDLKAVRIVSIAPGQYGTGFTPKLYLDRFAPAITRKGVGIAGVDHQRAGRAGLDLLASQLDFGRAADVFREHTGDRGPFGEFEISEVAAPPGLVARARDPRFRAGDRRHCGKGQGKRRAIQVHGGAIRSG